jgi:sugar fermentation stimulation protein A
MAGLGENPKLVKMRYEPALIPGTLIRRYKRFLADIRLEDGSEITAHCPNPGSMLRVGVPGRPVAVSRSDNPKRKLAYTWEMIDLDGSWVGVHTGRTNALVEEALRAGHVAELAGFAKLRREVPHGASRLDFRLTFDGAPDCYVEVKNVTLTSEHTDERRRAIFPDSVTLRGQKHLRELIGLVRAGRRAVMLFLVNRDDCDEFGPADEIDPVYGTLLREAANKGVELLAYTATVTPKQVTLNRSIPTVL